MTEYDIHPILKKIHDFADHYLDVLVNTDIPLGGLFEGGEYSLFEGHGYMDSCVSLGFEMDCANAFIDKYGEKAFDNDLGFKLVVDKVYDVPSLCSAIFSQYRKWTHWMDYSSPGEHSRNWAIMALDRLRYLTSPEMIKLKDEKAEQKEKTDFEIPPMFEFPDHDGNGKPLLDITETHITGTQFNRGSYIKPQDAIKSLWYGEQLYLKAEPENKYDEYAVSVNTRQDVQIGWIPREHSKPPTFQSDVSRRLQAGETVLARQKRRFNVNADQPGEHLVGGHTKAPQWSLIIEVARYGKANEDNEKIEKEK